MIILLDENFPLRFYTRLQREGLSVEHILLTHRGIFLAVIPDNAPGAGR